MNRETINKIELYITSLWFLFLLIIVVTIDMPLCFGSECRFLGSIFVIKNNVVPIVSFLFLMFGVLFIYRFDSRISIGGKIPVKIIKIEDLNYEHLTFLTTYIIPLICFNLTSTRYLLALAILLIVIGLIYIKTDKFYANPTLAVLGFRLYKVTIETRVGVNECVILITKDKLSNLDRVRTLEVNFNVLFARKCE